MRKKIVAGNWKMNCTLEEGRKLASEVINMVNDEVKNDVEVILIPPYLHLSNVQSLLKTSDQVYIGAQNCHEAKSGAFTGEVSASMLASAEVNYVVLGHSERREYFGETDQLLSKKIAHAIEANLKPIYCCGEKIEIRESGDHKNLVAQQVEEALFGLTSEQLQLVTIAYEPVWAIGTGKTATADQAQEMHDFIRTKIANQYNQELANSISILYGGSVKPGNAEEIFAKPDVDGGLIGGASLKSRDFIDIAKSFL